MRRRARGRTSRTDWSPKAEALHGISREMLARDGVPVHDVARHLNLALADRVAVLSRGKIVAHGPAEEVVGAGGRAPEKMREILEEAVA